MPHEEKTLNDLERLWNAALGEIEIQISRPNFLTWFKNSALLDRKDGTAVVGLPNSFAKEWVEHRYQKVVLGAIRALDDTTKKVDFIVSAREGAYIQRGTNIQHSSPAKEEFGFPEFRIDPDTNLNPKYTLSSFIVGSSNELAHTAATSIVKEVGTKYNPLFLYGGVGVGKTHLIQAIGNEIKQKYKHKIRVKYISSEKFTNEVISALKNKRMETLKEKYRAVDVLIVDDIQFVAGKQRTEEEFFHTFNALYEQNKQIILSSDRHPRSIPVLEERLRSRFEGGMTADIGAPDYELRVAVLKTKLQERGASISDDVISAIAERAHRNFRELEGALNKLLFYSQTKKGELTRDVVASVLGEEARGGGSPVNPAHIIKTVADFFEISLDDLTGPSRKKQFVEPRQITIYLLRELTNMSYPFIGERLGSRDHTTIIYAHNKIAQSLITDQQLKQKVSTIKEMVSKK